MVSAGHKFRDYELLPPAKLTKEYKTAVEEVEEEVVEESPPMERRPTKRARSVRRSPSMEAPPTLPMEEPTLLPPTLVPMEEEDEPREFILILMHESYAPPIRFQEQITVGRRSWRMFDDPSISREVVTLTERNGLLYARAKRRDVFLTNKSGESTQLPPDTDVMVGDGDEINQRNFRFKILLL
jgi:hypothetical protein